MPDKCEKYGIAITNYVLGEDLRMSQEELFTHLRECKQCLNELIDWQNTYAVMRAKEYDSRPENKEKMAKMLENLKKQVFGIKSTCITAKGETLINTEWEIGSAAGTVYRYVEKNGKSSTIQIIKDTNLNLSLVDQGIGWLAREKKVCVSYKDNLRYIYLPKQENKQSAVMV
jgi:ribosomal protein L29